MNEFDSDESVSLDEIEVHALTADELSLIAGGMMKMDEGINASKLAAYKEVYGEMWF